MLILQRKKNEVIRVGNDIRIIVTDIGNESVRIAIEAPTDVKVLREELIEAASANKKSAEVSRQGLEKLLQLMKNREPEN